MTPLGKQLLHATDRKRSAIRIQDQMHITKLLPPVSNFSFVARMSGKLYFLIKKKL